MPVLKLLARIWAWNALPNARHAYFYNLWAGRSISKASSVAGCGPISARCSPPWPTGGLTARVAAELPLTSAAEAMRLAESGTVAGKVILTG